nr:hypothetical protein GCM10020241_45470 [Streptoalloteichus tenebrarius]
MLDDLSRYLGSESNRELVLTQLVQHVPLALLPLVVGVVLAIPLGWLAQRHPLVRTALLGSANVVYTVPSLAFFVVIPGIIGTQILDPVNVVAALSIYTAGPCWSARSSTRSTPCPPTSSPRRPRWGTARCAGSWRWSCRWRCPCWWRGSGWPR